jgi:hypothetical protein
VYGRSTKVNQKNGLKVSTESRARNLAASPARVTRVARSELRLQRKRMKTMMRLSLTTKNRSRTRLMMMPRMMSLSPQLHLLPHLRYRYIHYLFF